MLNWPILKKYYKRCILTEQETAVLQITDNSMQLITHHQSTEFCPFLKNF